ncbi:MAG: hypothetical protein HYW65_03110 [Candidatus Liptonbacteria bacterium]|nr:hypothetical protein [Candidatus Liptonbacteria bacterium]
MRIAALLALALVLVVLGIEVRRFWAEGNGAEQTMGRIEEKLRRAESESAELDATIQYYREPENLEKEMRARFNYRSAGEKLLILVPKEPTSTASSVPAASP